MIATALSSVLIVLLARVAMGKAAWSWPCAAVVFIVSAACLTGAFLLDDQPLEGAALKGVVTGLVNVVLFFVLGCSRNRSPASRTGPDIEYRPSLCAVCAVRCALSAVSTRLKPARGANRFVTRPSNIQQP